MLNGLKSGALKDSAPPGVEDEAEPEVAPEPELEVAPAGEPAPEAEAETVEPAEPAEEAAGGGEGALVSRAEAEGLLHLLGVPPPPSEGAEGAVSEVSLIEWVEKQAKNARKAATQQRPVGPTVGPTGQQLGVQHLDPAAAALFLSAVEVRQLESPTRPHIPRTRTDTPHAQLMVFNR